MECPLLFRCGTKMKSPPRQQNHQNNSNLNIPPQAAMAAASSSNLILSLKPPTKQNFGSFPHRNHVSFPKIPIPKFSLNPPKPDVPLNGSPSKTLTPKPKTCLSSFIKPTIVTITAAALLLSRLPKPSLACPPPNPSPNSRTQTLEEIDADTDQSIEELRSLLDARIKSNDIYDAVSIVDRLIELEPENSDLPLLKSHLLIQCGDTQLAKQLFEQIISGNPYSVEAYHGLVMAQREAEESLDGVLERVESAIKMCEKEKRREDLRDFKLLKAEIKVAEGKYEEGIRVYEELRKEEPTDFRVYLCEGIVYTLMRKKDEAEKRFEKYRRLVPRGHKYARYFEDGVIAMKVLGEMEESKRSEGLKV